MAAILNHAAPSPLTAPSINDAGKPGVEKSGQGSDGPGNVFRNLVKETINTSKASDSASVAAANGTINDLELVRIMTEAEISLQRFKTVYESTKQSLDKVLNMNL